jgi:hypothetical protein
MTTLSEKQATSSAPATCFSQVRPGLVIYDSSWNGPAIVVKRDGDMVHLLTGLGYCSKDVKDLEAQEVPVLDSPLDQLAAHIFAGFCLNDKTAPFAERGKHTLPILLSPEGEAFRLALLKALRLDAASAWTADDLLEEAERLHKDSVEEYQTHQKFRHQIVDALGMSRLGHELGDDRSTEAILDRIKKLTTQPAKLPETPSEASASTSDDELPSSPEGAPIMPLDLRRYHALAVELETMFYAATEENADSGGGAVSLELDGVVVPKLRRLDKSDFSELTSALDDVRWRAELFVEFAMTAMVRAKLNKAKIPPRPSAAV